MSKTVIFQTVHLSISKQFQCQKTVLFQTDQFSIGTQFLCQKKDLFQTIQFSICTQFSSFWHIDNTLSSATTLSPSGPGSNGNEGVLHIPPKLQHYWSLTIRLFSVIYRTLIGGGVLPLCREAVSIFYSLSHLSKHHRDTPQEVNWRH